MVCAHKTLDIVCTLNVICTPKKDVVAHVMHSCRLKVVFLGAVLKYVNCKISLPIHVVSEKKGCNSKKNVDIIELIVV